MRGRSMLCSIVMVDGALQEFGTYPFRCVAIVLSCTCFRIRLSCGGVGHSTAATSGGSIEAKQDTTEPAGLCTCCTNHASPLLHLVSGSPGRMSDNRICYCANSEAVRTE